MLESEAVTMVSRTAEWNGAKRATLNALLARIGAEPFA
jgi:hypothetical protein